MRILVFSIFFLTIHCFAETNTKQVWAKFVKITEEGTKAEVLDVLSGEVKNRAARFGVNELKESINKSWLMNKAFLDGEDTLLINISKNKIKQTALFKFEDKKWKLYELRHGFANSKLSTAQKMLLGSYYRTEKIALKVKMQRIHKSVSEYALKNENSMILEPENIGINKRDLVYNCPREGTEKKLLFAIGFKFTKKRQYILAVTEDPLKDKHYALFDDGHIAEITKRKFKKHLSDFQPSNEKTVNLTKQKEQHIAKLIKQLGAESFRERKASKQKMLQLEYEVLAYLNTKEKETEDIETKESLKEIIKTITERGPTRTPHK